MFITFWLSKNPERIYIFIAVSYKLIEITNYKPYIFITLRLACLSSINKYYSIE